MSQNHWTTQSPVTDPGADSSPAAEAIDALPADMKTLRACASHMLLHYHGRRKEVPDGRLPEIHTRYAASMFELLLARDDGNEEPSPSPLAKDRAPADRFVGCCRDATVMFLSLARRKGIPARARLGFASYFSRGWWIDHVVAEVWDGACWRLVDPQMEREDEEGRDWFDLTPEQFMTGPLAWRAARAGDWDPEKFAVDPALDIPETRGWRYLAHNVVHDLVAMRKTEMLLWDAWGMILAQGLDGVPESDAVVLDEVSEAMVDADVKRLWISSLPGRSFSSPQW